MMNAAIRIAARRVHQVNCPSLLSEWQRWELFVDVNSLAVVISASEWSGDSRGAVDFVYIHSMWTYTPCVVSARNTPP